MIASSISRLEKRVPNCVKSGPTEPPSPLTVWQEPHLTARNNSLPRLKFRTPVFSSTTFSAESTSHALPGPFGPSTFSASLFPCALIRSEERRVGNERRRGG